MANPDEIKSIKSSYVFISTIGFIALGPCLYLFADGGYPYFIIPGGVILVFWKIYRPAVVAGFLASALSFLILMGLFGKPYHLVKEEIKQLTDPDRLAQIAQQHPKKLVRKEAVLNKSLTSEAIFHKIVYLDSSYEVRVAAQSRLDKLVLDKLGK